MAPPPDLGGSTLAAKLEVSGLAVRLLAGAGARHRADLECVETMAEFRRMAKAITRAGQIKGAGGRHEKDDRSRIDDRGRYVLGWSNESKIDAMISLATALAARITPAEGSAHRSRVRAAIAQARSSRAWTLRLSSPTLTSSRSSTRSRTCARNTTGSRRPPPSWCCSMPS